MRPMTKRMQIITAVILVLLILIAVLVGVAKGRGIVTFDGWKPKFSLTSLKSPRPSLDRPINFPADFPESGKELFNTNIAKIRAEIENSPSSNTAAWFDLAIYYRMVGDHAGAVEIWEYISALNPSNGVSIHNLGEYYFHTAKDYPKAEKYYLRSIAVAPELVSNYTDLFDMYVYVYKQDTSAAEDILKQGIAIIPSPGNIDLMIKLGEYYANKGDKGNARTWYIDARTAAQALKNAALVREIDRRLSSLR